MDRWRQANFSKHPLGASSDKVLVVTLVAGIGGERKHGVGQGTSQVPPNSILHNRLSDYSAHEMDAKAEPPSMSQIHNLPPNKPVSILKPAKNLPASRRNATTLAGEFEKVQNYPGSRPEHVDNCRLAREQRPMQSAKPAALTFGGARGEWYLPELKKLDELSQRIVAGEAENRHFQGHELLDMLATWEMISTQYEKALSDGSKDHFLSNGSKNHFLSDGSKDDLKAICEELDSELFLKPGRTYSAKSKECGAIVALADLISLALQKSLQKSFQKSLKAAQ